MIVGAIGDTHGNLRMMQDAAERLRRDHGAVRIYHLGDNYEDFEALAAPGAELRGVPGLWCAAFRNGAAPRVLVEQAAGWTLACAHTAEQLEGAPAQVLLHGHTHVARAELEAGRLWLNPGHLKAPRDRGQRPSYAVLALEADALTATIHELDGAPRMTRTVARNELRSVPA